MGTAGKHRSLAAVGMAVLLIAAVLCSCVSQVRAVVPQDGYTDAAQTVDAGIHEYDRWKQLWEQEKEDRTSIAITPGRDESELNFSWQSPASGGTPFLKIGVGKSMEDGQVHAAMQSDPSEETRGGKKVRYCTNKVTAIGLEKIRPITIRIRSEPVGRHRGRSPSAIRTATAFSSWVIRRLAPPTGRKIDGSRRIPKRTGCGLCQRLV